MSEFARYLLTASPAVIYTCMADSPYATTYVSENVLDLLGYEPHDFLEDPRFWIDRLHPEDLPAVLAGVDAVFTQGRHAYEYRFRLKDGSYRWLRDEIRLAYDDASKTSGIVGSWLDISERKALEERYRRFASLSSDYLHVCTRSGTEPYRIQWLDGAAEAITGYSAAELLERGCWISLVHPEDRPGVQSSLLGLTAGESSRIEFRIVTKTGEVRWVSEKNHCEAGPAGGLILSGAVTDITERKRTEEALREADRRTVEALRQTEFERDKTRAILEAMGDGISIQDPELRILYQNATHRSRMGDHLGEYCYRAYQGKSDVCPGCHLIQSFADGQVHMRETSASPGGELRHFQIVSTPLFDSAGKLIAGIEAVRDITERKRTEDHLRQKTDELEVANRELEAFSYTLSHDLRSYLTRVTLAAETLSELAAPRLEEKETFLLQTILGSTQSMDELIATMLSLAHISRQELHLETIDLSAMAERIGNQLALSEPGRTIRFTVSPAIEVVGDAHLLHVAMENLIGNAFKYTRGNAAAEISLSAKLLDGRQVFALTDNGSGFDMAEADKLFRPFQRLSSARALPGFGIGLTTVKRIVQRHGGEIWAEAAPGKGATFYFTLAG
ncbi:MAG: PAS domain S-box protein [Deltaproteobacteria bacterium]|nr:MAG: PAS domain S-box protein [Deltaproteobacteria bacterium]